MKFVPPSSNRHLMSAYLCASTCNFSFIVMRDEVTVGLQVALCLNPVLASVVEVEVETAAAAKQMHVLEQIMTHRQK